MPFIRAIRTICTKILEIEDNIRNLTEKEFDALLRDKRIDINTAVWLCWIRYRKLDRQLFTDKIFKK